MYIADPEEINQRAKMNLIQAGAGLLGIGLMSPLGRYTAVPALKIAAKTAWWGAKTAGSLALGTAGAVAGVGAATAPSILGTVGRVAYNATAGALWAGKGMLKMGIGAGQLGLGAGRTFMSHPAAVSIGALGAAGVAGAVAGAFDRPSAGYSTGASNATDIMGGTTRNVMNSLNATGDIVLGAHRNR
jgi:hypothetical protein